MEKIKFNLDIGSWFFMWLQLMFIYLKLTGSISWSWWLILSPIIIYFILTIIVGVIVLLWLLIKKE